MPVPAGSASTVRSAGPWNTSARDRLFGRPFGKSSISPALASFDNLPLSGPIRPTPHMQS